VKVAKRVLLSVVVGCLLMGSLILFSFYSATHQDSRVAPVGHVIAACLSMPIVVIFGHDRNVPTTALVVLAIVETLILSSLVFVVAFARGRRG
jgi:hypothetical protein